MNETPGGRIHAAVASIRIVSSWTVLAAAVITAGCQTPESKTTGGPAPTAAAEVLTDRELVAATYPDRGRMSRITASPVPMNPRVAMMCMGPEGLAHQDPHAAYSANVYVSATQADSFRHRINVFPAGTIIVKEKLRGLDGGPSAELFTGMLKREPGYHPAGGDWEWFVVAGPAGLRQVVARGQPTSCLDCHEKHRATGFITSRYP